MTDFLRIHDAMQPGKVGPCAQPGADAAGRASDGRAFQDMLLNSLNEVNRLQQEAADGVQAVLTGQSDNVAEVFSAVRKADVAFSMLMEMRNKLIDAYQELQQMRI